MGFWHTCIFWYLWLILFSTFASSPYSEKSIFIFNVNLFIPPLYAFQMFFSWFIEWIHCFHLIIYSSSYLFGRYILAFFMRTNLISTLPVVKTKKDMKNQRTEGHEGFSYETSEGLLAFALLLLRHFSSVYFIQLPHLLVSCLPVLVYM